MKIEIKCNQCGLFVFREKGEVNRSLKLGRRLFCSQTCSTKSSNALRIARGEKFGSPKNLDPGNRLDVFSPFRYFLRKIRSRHKKYGFPATDIDLVFLQEIWSKQNGICPLSGWEMHLPATTLEWEKKKELDPRTASLDRIEPRKPYVKDNVRFVTHIANMAKFIYTDEEVIAFCKAVTTNRPNLA